VERLDPGRNAGSKNPEEHPERLEPGGAPGEAGARRSTRRGWNPEEHPERLEPGEAGTRRSTWLELGS